jgi:hypothetical protein
MPVTDTRWARCSSGGGVEQLLHLAKLAVAPDERRLEAVGLE